MKNQLILDLKVARRQAGLTQADCAYLLGMTDSAFAKLEKGKRELSAEYLCLLSIIHNWPLDELMATGLQAAKAELAVRLETLPAPSTRWMGTFNRQNSLSALAERLCQIDPQEHAGD